MSFKNLKLSAFEYNGPEQFDPAIRLIQSLIGSCVLILPLFY
jgi:hypothetical protein